MTTPSDATVHPLRVLFLSTRNDARSQMAEAVLAAKGGSRFVAASAGSQPVAEVHPLTITVLAELGIDWSAARVKGLDAVAGLGWDLVIIVSDRIRELPPTLPGHPVFAHWRMEHPARAVPDERRIFRNTALEVQRRIELLLAIPFERLSAKALEDRVRTIGAESPELAHGG